MRFNTVAGKNLNLFAPLEKDALRKNANMLERDKKGGFKIPNFSLKDVTPYKFDQHLSTEDLFKGKTKDYSKEIKPVNNLMVEMNKTLAKNAYLNSIVGDSYDELNSQIQVHMGVISDLLDLQDKGWDVTPQLDAQKAIIKNLQDKEGALSQDLLTEREYLDKKYAMDIAHAEKVGKDTSLITYKYNKAVNEVKMKDLQMYLQAASQAIDSISSLVEASKQRELSAVGDNAKAREQIEKEYFQRQKKWAIAQAIINGALAVTNMIAHIPGSVINPATWVGIGIAVASTIAQIAVISGQKMAEGGVVPPGYPNDTFPAMLTSGERVIPAGLSNLSSQNGMEGRVVFEIHQDTLRGILNKANVRNALV